MVNIQFDELTVENLGSWPVQVKIVALAMTFLLIIMAGYWFDTRAQLNSLDQKQAQEIQLKQTFDLKQNQVANISEYKQQYSQMEKTFGKLLMKLPSESEVPGLLEDISKAGIASGLEFKLFKPLPEKRLDFYAELPIDIMVTGTYYQLATFISRLANLERIVTIHNFSIKPQSNQSSEQVANKPEKLIMKMTARTYQYISSAQPADATLKNEGSNETT